MIYGHYGRYKDLTMKTFIIYDSVFGNTEQIAQAIFKTLKSEKNIVISKVTAITLKQLNGVELLIVGSPTRGFRPTKAISDFLKSFPQNRLKNIKIAAFDTRVDINEVKLPILTFLVNRFGYAAEFIAKILKENGGNLLVPPEGFFVKDKEGPLKEGEIERATKWAKALIRQNS